MVMDLKYWVETDCHLYATYAKQNKMKQPKEPLEYFQ